MYDDLVAVDDFKCVLRGGKNNTPGLDGVQHGHTKQLSDAEFLSVMKDFEGLRRGGNTLFPFYWGGQHFSC